MDESTAHKGKPAKVVQPGVQIAKGFLRWLVTLLIPSHEDLLKAGVYLDERNDRLQSAAQQNKLKFLTQAAMFGGEELIYEKMRRNNDERPDLLPAERYSRSNGRVDEE